MNDQELQQAFIQFLAQKSGAKDQKQLEQYIKFLGEEGLKQAYAEFTKIMQKNVKRAEHGAKLQYIKKLKKVCNDDEELIYFKKGGSITCGCKKKENGGTVPQKKKMSVVEKFKAACGTKLLK